MPVTFSWVLSTKAESASLSGENHRQFYISQGFAHGFIVLSETAEFFYKCTDFYHPEDEGGLLWNDPDVGIEWPSLDGASVNINERDRRWPGLRDAFRY